MVVKGLSSGPSVYNAPFKGVSEEQWVRPMA